MKKCIFEANVTKKSKKSIENRLKREKNMVLSKHVGKKVILISINKTMLVEKNLKN